MANRLAPVMTTRFSKLGMHRAREVKIWFIYCLKGTPVSERQIGAMVARCFPVDM